MKKVLPLHDDRFHFFYEALPGDEAVGRGRVLLGSWGSFNDLDVCDYTYAKMTDGDRGMLLLWTWASVIAGEAANCSPFSARGRLRSRS